ncbi:helix-turn-helix transcriptional regulator [Clostridium polynesiense]|uniref:helix-turn-helix transcriptional regulator n=1 Tax=Clostridium polynesiense TaxID=1325933 RepID=UPI0005910E04|nr:YafY family protein [Clostridium polynesiense]
MTKVKTLFDLIFYVNSKKSFTAQDVAYEFKISVRTAHRYLMELSEMGIPLYTEQGRGGGYRVLKNRMLPPVLFDENEALSIFFSFQSLKYYNSLPFDADIESASRKLYYALPEDVKGKIDSLESVFSFWNPKSDIAAPFLKDCIDASINNDVLIMKYKSEKNDKTRRITPIGVYGYDGLWYMPALDIESNKVKIFRLDRIISLEASSEKYDFNMTLKDWFNRDMAETPLTLHVLLTREGIRQCRSMPFFQPHITETAGEEGYIHTVMDTNDIEFLSKYFLTLGSDAKVIKPKKLVSAMKEKIEKLTELYKDYIYKN